MRRAVFQVSKQSSDSFTITDYQVMSGKHILAFLLVIMALLNGKYLLVDIEDDIEDIQDGRFPKDGNVLKGESFPKGGSLPLWARRRDATKGEGRYCGKQNT